MMAPLLALLLANPGREVVVLSRPNVKGPIAFGLRELTKVLREKGRRARLASPPEAPAGEAVVVGSIESDAWLKRWAREARLKVPLPAESFAIGKLEGRRVAVVAGRDDVGAMYGLLELAERMDMGEGDWFRAVVPVSKSPFLAVRAVNLFICLPFGGETWENWWFLSEDYWRTLLDLMARSRLNVLDLHGMYDIVTTGFPNIFPYFVQSERFPKVGLPPEIKRRNLEMLRKVVGMAAERGIKVAIMSYHTSWAIRENPKPPYEPTEENIALYNRECTRKLLEEVPGLWLVGFRIGESGRSEDFFKRAHIAGVLDSGRRAGVYTRTWLVKSKQKILELGRMCPGDFFIEIKFNGEHLGLPYHVAGGRMASWHSYSFQRYPCFPRNYRIIWQIRACGTHRIFPWGWPEFVRRTVLSCKLDGAAGFTLEPIDAYYPKFDYFHAEGVDHRFFRWTHQRYWFWHTLWGRLAYDPNVPEGVWLHMFERRFGREAGPEVYRMVVEMSKIVPWIYAYHCLGPDHRQMAPEMETGGDLDAFAVVPPLDTLVMASPAEYVGTILSGRPLTKVGPFEVAGILSRAARGALRSARKVKGLLRSIPSGKGRKEAECLATDAEALAHLGNYYASKLIAATYLAIFRETRDYIYLKSARGMVERAVEEWGKLAEVTKRHYRPLPENLRMRKLGHPYPPGFHWAKEGEKLKRDVEIIEGEEKKFEESIPGPDEPPLLAHVPSSRTIPRYHYLTVTAASRARIRYVKVFYRPKGETFKAVEMERIAPFTYGALLFVPGDARRLEYYFVASTDRGKASRLPEKGLFTVLLTEDSEGPRMRLLRLRKYRLPGGGRSRLEIAVRAEDPSGVKFVDLVWKPLPSEERWRRLRMRPAGEGAFTASLDISPDGALLCFEGVDKLGSGAMFPDFRRERPYFVVEPWFDPATKPPPRPFSLIERRLISPDKFSAMVLGRTALRFHELCPPEGKRYILRLVERGLSLVIFNQDFPGRFDLSFLPGGIEGTDEDFGRCRIVKRHPVVRGLPREIEADKVVNDALKGGEGWLHLTEPSGLAIRRHGKGWIVLCQLRALELSLEPAFGRLVKNILDFAADGKKGKPVLVLDPGNGLVLDVLGALGVRYVLLSEVPLRK